MGSVVAVQLWARLDPSWNPCPPDGDF